MNRQYIEDETNKRVIVSNESGELRELPLHDDIRELLATENIYDDVTSYLRSEIRTADEYKSKMQKILNEEEKIKKARRNRLSLHMVPLLVFCIVFCLICELLIGETVVEYFIFGLIKMRVLMPLNVFLAGCFVYGIESVYYYFHDKKENKERQKEYLEIEEDLKKSNENINEYTKLVEKIKKKLEELMSNVSDENKITDSGNIKSLEEEYFKLFYRELDSIVETETELVDALDESESTKSNDKNLKYPKK